MTECRLLETLRAPGTKYLTPKATRVMLLLARRLGVSRVAELTSTSASYVRYVARAVGYSRRELLARHKEARRSSRCVVIIRAEAK